MWISILISFSSHTPNGKVCGIISSSHQRSPSLGKREKAFYSELNISRQRHTHTFSSWSQLIQRNITWHSSKLNHTMSKKQQQRQQQRDSEIAHTLNVRAKRVKAFKKKTYCDLDMHISVFTVDVKCLMLLVIVLLVATISTFDCFKASHHFRGLKKLHWLSFRRKMNLSFVSFISRIIFYSFKYFQLL